MNNAIKRIEVDKLNVEHVLRPEFTRLILDLLVNHGDSINLVGEKGTGKSRLIKDIRRCSLPAVKILYVDVKSYKKTFAKLLEAFYSQLELTGPLPDSLSQLFAGIEKRPGRFLVMLDNYDALLGNPDLDPGYNDAFFPDLNGLKNKGNVSLLCTTCFVHHSRPVYIGGNTMTSPLTLDIHSLPPLTYNEIENEIHGRLDEYNRMDIQTHPEDKKVITGNIHDNKLPYPRLKWFCAKINEQSEEERVLPFKKKFKHWNKVFDKNSSESMEKSLYRATAKVKGMAIASKANKIKIPILSNIHKLMDKLIDKIKS